MGKTKGIKKIFFERVLSGKKCPKSKKMCNFFLRIILSFEKKLEKVKIFKKSLKLQFLPDFQKLLTKMCGRPRALKKIYNK